MSVSDDDDDAKKKIYLERAGWPRALLVMIFDMCDDRTAGMFALVAGPQFHRYMSTKLREEERKLDLHRDRVISVFVRLLKNELHDPKNVDDLFTPEGRVGLRKYLRRMRRVGLSDTRRSALAKSVVKMLRIRTAFVFPVLRMSSAFDFLSGLHFSKCECLLHQTTYFDNTLRYFLLIRRRAALDGFECPDVISNELSRYDAYQRQNQSLLQLQKIKNSA